MVLLQLIKKFYCGRKSKFTLEECGGAVVKIQTATHLALGTIPGQKSSFSTQFVFVCYSLCLPG